MMRLGYGHLDAYAAWKANQYFDLDAAQRAEFLRRFDRLHEWHRREELPDYVRFLGETRVRLERPLAREDVEWFIEGVRARYARIVSHAVDDAAALLYTVTPAQLDTLQREWDEDNRRFAREYRLNGSIEDIRRARARRTLEQVREWAGRLETDQEKRITALTDALPPLEKLRYEDRLRRQREFLRLVRERGEDRARFAARLRDWLIDWDKGRVPEYERRYREWLAQREQMVVEIARMLKPEQRTRVLGRLDGYMEDFTRLARRPAAQAARN
ncbi:MAG TPA: DUF6279 family lipoprotein [Burkholderiales bacterium]|nr:DUF6279 family lipoprotein [Burkholderiales bacterium]